MRIGVTGATGFIGTHLLKGLRADQHEVIALSRGKQSVDPALRTDEGITFHSVDMTDVGQLESAFTNCDAIAHLAGINYERGTQTYDRVHRAGTAALLDAITSLDIDRVVMTSYLRARPNCGSGYLQSKWDTEEQLRQAPVEGTILKPAAVFGEGDQLITQLARWLQRVPITPRIGVWEPQLRPVAVEDVVTVIVAALTENQLTDTTVPLMGPHRVTLGELGSRISMAMDRRSVALPLPGIAARIAAAGMERVFDPPILTRAGVRMIAEGMTTPAPIEYCTSPPANLVPNQEPTIQYLKPIVETIEPLGRAQFRV